MTRVQTDLTHPAAVRAIEASLQAQWAVRGLAPEYELHDSPELLWVYTGAPFRAFNCVLRTRLEPAEADARIAETVAYFAARDVPMIWWVEPSARPPDLGKRLEAHGLQRMHDLPGMALDLATLRADHSAPAGLKVQHVQDDGTLRTFIHAAVIGFGLPPEAEQGLFEINARAGFGKDDGWRHYLALLDGEPVGTASVFLGVGVAGINIVTTMPHARRQGIGTAATLAPLLYARDRGFRIAALESSEMATGVYRRMGFREFCKFGLYTRAAPSQAAPGPP